MRRPPLRPRLTLGVAAVCLASLATPAFASHDWGGYHWARGTSPFTVTLGDSMSATWDPHLAGINADWSRTGADAAWPDLTPPPPSERLDSPLRTRIAATLTSAKRCGAVTGRVEVCNYTYGRKGWLGLASVWLSGTHITKATAKLNDTYFKTTPYNTPAWRRSVLCQEVGHAFGLDHQSEDGGDLDTCMDYSTVPNEHPDQHDYDLLGAVYAHTDTTTTLASSGATGARAGNARLRRDIMSVGVGDGLQRVRDDLWVENLGNGRRRVVHVRWVNGGVPHRAPAEG